MSYTKNLIREYFEKELGEWANSFTDEKLRLMAVKKLEEIRPSKQASAGDKCGNPIRIYFRNNIGSWAEKLSDDELDQMVLDIIKPKTILAGDGVVSGAIIGGGNFSSGNVKFVDKEVQFTDYDIEIEDAVFSFPLKNGSGQRYQKYAGVVVKDKIGNNRAGMPISGYFDHVEDVQGGIVIKNGKTLYVKGMKRADIAFPHDAETDNLRSADAKRDHVAGKFVYLFDANVFKNYEKHIIETADDSSFANESKDGKYIRLVVDRKRRNGVNNSYALYHAYAAIDEKGTIIKG